MRDAVSVQLPWRPCFHDYILVESIFEVALLFRAQANKMAAEGRLRRIRTALNIEAG
jgi:hypothetical protein